MLDERKSVKVLLERLCLHWTMASVEQGHVRSGDWQMSLFRLKGSLEESAGSSSKQ